jgi:hypothetical protein
VACVPRQITQQRRERCLDLDQAEWLIGIVLPLDARGDRPICLGEQSVTYSAPAEGIVFTCRQVSERVYTGKLPAIYNCMKVKQCSEFEK